MIEITLSLAVLLAVGFLAAKVAQLLRLPSVTGYICAGVLLGPSGLGIITEEALSQQLGHFTQIALMLIAFGIGEHLDLRQLRQTAKSVGYVGLGETSGAFWLVGIGAFLVARATSVGHAEWGLLDFATLALLLGAVSVATAPAATLHVMRELRAAGPLTSTLMAVVAVDDGLAIIIFGIAMSVARHLSGGATDSITAAAGASLGEIASSLVIGAVAGLIIDLVVHQLNRRGEMLTVGLALLLLAGEGARLMQASPLLAGMAAGFTIVNRDRRDVRVFRAINDFEPPIYALFFTLAGAHLDLSALAVAGLLGLTYAVLRVAGKMAGANLGARVAGAPAAVRRWLGLALAPQAGVAIGLIFLIQGDERVGIYSSIITPVVLAGVVLSELVGPVLARIAVQKAGEVGEEVKGERQPKGARKEVAGGPVDIESIELVPWTWEQLEPPENPTGSVIFGVAHPATAPALARIATILAHHHRARLLAVRVLPPASGQEAQEREAIPGELLAAAETEVRSMGYDLATEVVTTPSVPAGLVSAAREHRATAIVLGHPLAGTSRAFDRVVEQVAREAACPVIVVRSAGALHTERILVPVANVQELELVRTVVRALAAVGPHRITLLRTVRPEATQDEIEAVEAELIEWARTEELPDSVRGEAVKAEARLETICEATAGYDLLVMPAMPRRGLQRLFFGSLAEDLIRSCDRPVLIVRGERA